MFLVIVCAAVVACSGSYLLSLYKNYKAALSTGLPSVITPIDPTTPIFGLLHDWVLPCLTMLPGDLGRNSGLLKFGWQFRDKYATHERLGKLFVQVTPTCNVLHVGDPEICEEVMRRWEDFPKPRQIYQHIEQFGPNVDSVNGEAWKRNRRITTPAFNERVSTLVWEEASRQASQMLHTPHANTPSKATNSLAQACKTIALHVLTYAGFGVRGDFGSGVTTIEEGFSLTYQDALSFILSHMVMATVLPGWLTRLPFVPKTWRKLGLSMRDFGRQMEDMLKRERMAIHTDKIETNRRTETLTSALIRASEADKADDTDAIAKSAKGLSDEEIYGNLFIFNFAGHDTTAITMSYAIALMAIHPSVQAWVADEVRAVFAQNDKTIYHQVFPRLVRVRALMYETLRLYPPLSFLSKITGARPVPLTLGSEDSVIVPPNTYVNLNFVHLHVSPEFWGADSLTFFPQRFIVKSEVGEETLFKPERSVFIPWATGPRNCPGMKFSQVEFISAISELLSTSRVAASLPPEMGGAEVSGLDDGSRARERLQRVLDASDVQVLTTILNPENVWLSWEKADS